MTGRRVLVVSMPNVVPHNQLTYQRLAELGWEVKYVVPNRWRDDYTPGGFTPAPLDGIVGTFARLRVALPGQVQRHFYVTRPARWLRRWHPDAIFVELEPFSVPALQWGLAAERLGIPWGVQGDENLDRPLPWPARLIRDWSMPRIDFFAARSPGGEQMLRRWGARAEIGIVPHTIPDWEPPERTRSDDELFTVGFAGRLTEAKGIRDLLAAVRRLDFRFRLLVVGDGPLRRESRPRTSDMACLSFTGGFGAARCRRSTPAWICSLCLLGRRRPGPSSSARCSARPCSAALP